MVKTYHRYVRHTSDIQTQAQNLLNERQKGDAAAKVEKEEMELWDFPLSNISSLFIFKF